MGSQYKSLTQEDISFIAEQKLFYMASASGQEVNLSPKGFDSIHILAPDRMLYLDYPGSGNRTARDIRADGEVTLVFNAFSGSAKILRLFCKGRLVEKSSSQFMTYLNHFSGVAPEHVRRIIILNIYAIESSCGMGVPKMEFIKERTGLKKWIESEIEKESLESYIQEHETPPNLSDI